MKQKTHLTNVLATVLVLILAVLVVAVIINQCMR